MVGLVEDRILVFVRGVSLGVPWEKSVMTECILRCFAWLSLRAEVGVRRSRPLSLLPQADVHRRALHTWPVEVVLVTARRLRINRHPRLRLGLSDEDVGVRLWL